MDPALPKKSMSNSDVKPSFRKPAQDAANRKYRRHTPNGGLDSSSSGGSPKRRSCSPVYSDDRWRKDDRKKLERDSNYNRSSRGTDSCRHSDKHSHGTVHDYAKNGDYSRHHRHADDEDRGYHRSSRSGQESRSGTNSDYMRHDSNSDRSREIWRTGNKRSRDKYESAGHGSKDKDYRYNDRDFDKAMEMRDVRRDRRRSPDDYRNDHRYSREEPRAHGKDSILGRESSSMKSKDLHSGNEIDLLKDKRKHDDRESDRCKEKSSTEADAEMKSAAEPNTSLKKLKHYDSEDDNPSSTSEQAKGKSEKFTSEPVCATADQSETAQDLNAAKVAAMKAAELVNRNLAGRTSYLSTDQKKKLLWGNKKNTSTEESGNRWDLQLFADRERQEKFNKLMSLRLPWYLWPIVGCEGRRHSRVQAERDGCREEAEAGDGLGEAVHRRSPPKRRSNCRPRPVKCNDHTPLSSPLFSSRTHHKHCLVNITLQTHSDLFVGNSCLFYILTKNMLSSGPLLLSGLSM